MTPAMRALAALAIALLASGCGRVVPVERPAPLLEEEVLAAAKIARVRVDRVEPIRPATDRTNPICGYRYFVHVVEQLKGGQEPSAFLAATNKLLPGHDYLVFVHKLSDAAGGADQWDDYQSPAGKRLLMCGTPASEYVLPISRQTYFGFGLDGADQFGGEWLAPRDPANVLGFTWCNSDWPSNAAVAKRNVLRFREVRTGGVERRMVEWQSAKQAIEAALKNPPYWLGVIPNPFFKPAAC